MTSPIAFPAHVIGLMSGTSADGVDAALVRTDGHALVEPHESEFLPYEENLRRDLLKVMQGLGNKQAVGQALTLVHIEAVKKLIDKTGITPAAIGFHGQTIRHDPAKGITEQIGDAALMAKTLGIPVVADFRSNDVKHGGQGAPLVPLYHAALAEGLPKPLMIVNIGGVANVTWIGDAGKILAFDCGPGNALLDDWMYKHTGFRYDRNGEHAARGQANEQLLARWLGDPFIAASPPKSLDRNHFAEITASLGDATLEEGAATLTAFTARAIAQAVKAVPETPKQLMTTGGGRHNPTLIKMITERIGCPIAPVEAAGWDGDMLEAQAFAYLAARSILKLPLSLPTTTGVEHPVTGGVLYPA